MDGLPNIVLEALAAGAAVIATAAGGIGTVVEHEKTGLVVPERSAEAIAAALGARPRIRPFAPRSARLRGAWWRPDSGGTRTAERFEAAYRRALANKSIGR